MAFLVATGRLEGGAFVLRQYLAETPAEEPALLHALLDDARLCAEPVLVTYNGRRFDAPMLDQRATLHRLRAGFEPLRHVDLLHATRRVYGRTLPSCRLVAVEADVLGVTRPSLDVDGAEVPSWYFRFLRSGDMRFIGPLASHNEQDVLSLAGLVGHFGGLLGGAQLVRGHQAFGLARLCAGGDQEEAWLRRALDLLPPVPARDEVLWRLAAMHKRAGRRALAVPLWREIAEAQGALAVAALVELAKYREHLLQDFEQALEAVERALGSRQLDMRSRATLLHRRSRLSRRAARARLSVEVDS
jgi:hypothetical protein